MPRSNRQYLQRYCEQAQNDLERALERLMMLSNAYGGVWKPMDDEPMPELTDEPSEYEGPHGKYQQFVDIQASLLMVVKDNLEVFRTSFM